MCKPLQRLVGTTSHRLLARILESPNLPAEVRRLPPAALLALVDKIGLEDAGEIVALATTEQLAAVFDEDLWKNERPGEEERFDPDRFLLWLEVMLEAGEAFVAERLVELPEDLVILALHKQVLVLDLDELAAGMYDDRESAASVDKALASCLGEDIDKYQIISRRHEGWDAVLSALLALDRDHHDSLDRVLERCAAMSGEYIDDNGGLFEVLTSEEMLEGDVAADREERRAGMGYVAPAAAAAFLKLAKTKADTPPAERDPLTRAYFRDLERNPARTAAGGRPPGNPSWDTGVLAFAMREAGVTGKERPPLLPPASPEAAKESLLIRAMRRLGEKDPRLFSERSEEIAYLANVLIAGTPGKDGRLRPIDALNLAMEVVTEGLELALPANERTAPHIDVLETAVRALRSHTADALFRLAWQRRR